jgi:hypothetical protein
MGKNRPFMKAAGRIAYYFARFELRAIFVRTNMN